DQLSAQTNAINSAKPQVNELHSASNRKSEPSQAFRDHLADLLAYGAEHVFGLSTQTTEYQREAVDRLHLPYPLLSDAGMELVQAWRLPTFTAGELTLLTRLTLVLWEGYAE